MKPLWHESFYTAVKIIIAIENRFPDYARSNQSENTSSNHNLVTPILPRQLAKLPTLPIWVEHLHCSHIEIIRDIRGNNLLFRSQISEARPHHHGICVEMIQ